MIRVFSGVPGSYGNSYWALMGHTGKERKASKVGRTPPHGLVLIELGMMIPTIESRASNIPMTKGIMYVVMRFDR